MMLLGRSPSFKNVRIKKLLHTVNYLCTINYLISILETEGRNDDVNPESLNAALGNKKEEENRK